MPNVRTSDPAVEEFVDPESPGARAAVTLVRRCAEIAIALGFAGLCYLAVPRDPGSPQRMEEAFINGFLLICYLGLGIFFTLLVRDPWFRAVLMALGAVLGVFATRAGVMEAYEGEGGLFLGKTVVAAAWIGPSVAVIVLLVHGIFAGVTLVRRCSEIAIAVGFAGICYLAVPRDPNSPQRMEEAFIYGFLLICYLGLGTFFTLLVRDPWFRAVLMALGAVLGVFATRAGVMEAYEGEGGLFLGKTVIAAAWIGPSVAAIVLVVHGIFAGVARLMKRTRST